MSKKIKKNFGSITRLARTGSFKGSRSRPVSQTTRSETCRIVAGHQDHILAAMIHTQKCLPYVHEMINNYLHEARVRFDKVDTSKLSVACRVGHSFFDGIVDLTPHTLLKDRQSSLAPSHPIRILFICCVYFTLIMKL